MKKQSLWLDTEASPEYPKLKGEIEVDVLIVGAGITGITTAYLLKKAGCSVAVVDQYNVGGGETGHTTAHVTYVTDTRLSELVKGVGKQGAQALWDAGLHAMQQIEEIVGELKIECDLKRVPGYLFAALEKDAQSEKENLNDDAILATELGFDAALIDADPLFLRPAVRFANQLKFHPLKYVKAMAKAILGGGSYIFGQTSGSDIDAEKHELRTNEGRICYNALVAATHVPIQGERAKNRSETVW